VKFKVTAAFGERTTWDGYGGRGVKSLPQQEG